MACFNDPHHSLYIIVKKLKNLDNWKIEDKNPKSNHGETPLHLAAKSWSAVTEQGKYKLYVCEFL